MLIKRTFDAKECKRIAKASGVKQTVADVSYASRLHILYVKSNGKEGAVIRCLRSEHSFALYIPSSVSIRIICIVVDKENQGRGEGKLLLKLVEAEAKSAGISQLTTLTKSGVEFYARNGFDIFAFKGDEYRMKKIL